MATATRESKWIKIPHLMKYDILSLDHTDYTPKLFKGRVTCLAQTMLQHQSTGFSTTLHEFMFTPAMDNSGTLRPLPFFPITSKIKAIL